jgi:hypothetical protein
MNRPAGEPAYRESYKGAGPDVEREIQQIVDSISFD